MRPGPAVGVTGDGCDAGGVTVRLRGAFRLMDVGPRHKPHAAGRRAASGLRAGAQWPGADYLIPRTGAEIAADQTDLIGLPGRPGVPRKRVNQRPQVGRHPAMSKCQVRLKAPAFIRRRRSSPAASCRCGTRQGGQYPAVPADSRIEHPGPGRPGEGSRAGHGQRQRSMPVRGALQPRPEPSGGSLIYLAEECERYVPPAAVAPPQLRPGVLQRRRRRSQLVQRGRGGLDRDEQPHEVIGSRPHHPPSAAR